jgi:hypothetical protein
MSRRRSVDYELRQADSGVLLAAMTLPEGDQMPWEAPVGTERFDLREVELLADGEVVARGVWPDLEPV